jgi:hypothetical protein
LGPSGQIGGKVVLLSHLSGYGAHFELPATFRAGFPYWYGTIVKAVDESSQYHALLLLSHLNQDTCKIS